MINKIHELHDKYFSKPFYFLLAYTAIHFILILYAYFNIQNTFIPPIFYKFSFQGINANAVDMGYVYAYLLVLLIFIIDVAFLIVLMLEFKWLRLNYKKVLLLEIVLISISFMIPFFREIMFFMSFNTIGIYIIYRGLLPIWFFRTPFIFVSYIYLIRVIISPILELYKMSAIK